MHGNKAAVLPNGNGMANVHFRGEGWTSGRPDLTAEPYQGLIGDLLEQEPMDILAWREEDGLPVYLTLDAGPNPHLLCEGEHQEQILDAVEKLLPRAQVIANRPGPGTTLVEEHLL